MMTELRARGVGRVLWVNLSERRTTPYEVTNAALRAAARRWNEMVVLDWNAASDRTAADRWFTDGVHLTVDGPGGVLAVAPRPDPRRSSSDGYTPPRPLVPGEPLRVPVMGRGGVPKDGAGVDVVGVALNVTAVGPVAAWVLAGVAVWVDGAGDVVGELRGGGCDRAECGGGAGGCDG